MPHGSMLDLSGRTYLVTGAGGDGVGGGVCAAIREAGGGLVVNDIDAALTRDAGMRYDAILSVPGDVASAARLDETFREIGELQRCEYTRWKKLGR